MEIKYVSKNYKISDKFKDIVEKKLSKLEKYFNRDVDVKVACLEQNDTCKLEITINSRGLFIRSEVSSDNMYNNIDIFVPSEKERDPLCVALMLCWRWQLRKRKN